MRKTKRSELTLDMVEYVPRIEKKPGINGFELTLPAGGDKHINPGLLTQYLNEGLGFSESNLDIFRLAVRVKDGEPLS